LKDLEFQSEDYYELMHELRNFQDKIKKSLDIIEKRYESLIDAKTS
jgi:hypothetical protein